jgi:hypothetical protein
VSRRCGQHVRGPQLGVGVVNGVGRDKISEVRKSRGSVRHQPCKPYARREWSSTPARTSDPNDDGRFESTQLEAGAGVGQLACRYHGLRACYIFDAPRDFASSC